LNGLQSRKVYKNGYPVLGASKDEPVKKLEKWKAKDSLKSLS
jgi:hypothetical protein